MGIEIVDPGEKGCLGARFPAFFEPADGRIADRIRGALVEVQAAGSEPGSRNLEIVEIKTLV